MKQLNIKKQNDICFLNSYKSIFLLAINYCKSRVKFKRFDKFDKPSPKFEAPSSLILLELFMDLINVIDLTSQELLEPKNRLEKVRI